MDSIGRGSGSGKSRLEQLNSIALFDVCNSEEKAQLAATFKPETYAMGETVIRRGELSDAFYIVSSGRARTIGVTNPGQEISLGLLGIGEHFGEQSLLKDEPAQTTIAASTLLTVLKLERGAFAGLIAANPQLERYFLEYMAYEGMRVFLQHSTVLSHLDASAIRSLLDGFDVRSYAAGEPLVSEGEEGDAFYILRTGSAVVVRGEDRRVLNKLLPGDYFGELALLTEAPRKASVVADEPSTAFRLGKPEFESLIGRYPKIRQTMERIASYYTDAPLVLTAEDDEEAEGWTTDPAEGVRTADFADVSTKLGYADGRPIRSVRQRLADIIFRRRYPALMQQSDMDCGSTCLTMIVQYYGGRISLNRMRLRAGVSTAGTSLQGLADTAAALGLEAKGVKIGVDDLSGLKPPCILHWGGNHYVVLYEIHPDHVVVADPAVGSVEAIPLETLRDKWNGIALLLTPVGDTVRKVRDEESLLATFGPFLRPYKRPLAGILVLSVCIQLILLTFPVLTQVIVDKVLVHHNAPLLQVILIGMLLLACFEAAATFARQLLVARTALRLDLALMGAFYKKLFNLPYDFFTRRTIGDVMTRALESENIRRLLTDHAVYLLLDALALIIYGSVMFVYNVKLALISVSFLPLFAMLVVYVLPKMRLNSRKQFTAEGESQAQLIESVHAIATVKALAAEQVIRGKLKEKLGGLLQLRMKGYLLGASADTASGFLQVLGHVLLLYAGSRFVLQGELSVGELVAFTGLFFTMIHAVDSITRMLEQVSEARTSMERLNDVFEAEPEQSDLKKLRILPVLRGQVRFDNVAFRYESEGRNILQNVTFDIKPGQMIALVGRSGAGKTTFINLLLKLFSPSEGTIWVDGIDLRQAHAGSLRRQIGYVPQETVIFRGSVRENIAFHHPQSSCEEVEAAAKLAGAHEFIIGFPLSYETVIGEGGMRLSGGQRQRIAIARALIGDPRILIFDEATSALDTESEAAIQRNMERVLKDRTTLLIAHRLSTVLRADRIIVLDNGTIVESGKHEELLQAKGLYAHLVGQQLTHS